MDYDELLRRQRAAFGRGAPDRARREWALIALRDALRANEARIVEAISADFGGRSADETRLLELFPALDLIAHARKSLRGWMKPRRVRGSWFLLPSRAYTICQPVGVVGVLGAWNYPLLLTIGPLVSAIAAGNHAIVKASDKTPLVAQVIADLLGAAFPDEYVAGVTGDVEAARYFSSLAFDHLVFTGSTGVGAEVMRAASANLTPVTLELGGKSPAIIHESFPLDVAMRRILTGKLYNAGQTCVAPDYVLIPRHRAAEVDGVAREVVSALYPRLVDNPDYTRILNDDRYHALQRLVDDARAQGGRVVAINPAAELCSVGNRVFPPTLVLGAPPSARVLQEEIFGPILPVVTYDTLDEALQYVNARPRPLALYYFDGDASRADRVVSSTISGGVTINDVILHLGQHNLPFGGVGPSGMGHYHGYDGFVQFSKKKGVMVQAKRPVTGMLAPPFSAFRRRLIDRLIAIASR
jgi:coniferyl-aldehyde dehydrogenase